MSVFSSNAYYRLSQTGAVLFLPLTLSALIFYEVERRVTTHGLVEADRQAVLRAHLEKVSVEAIHAEDDALVEEGQPLLRFADLHGLRPAAARLRARIAYLDTRLASLRAPWPDDPGAGDGPATETGCARHSRIVRLRADRDRLRRRLHALRDTPAEDGAETLGGDAGSTFPASVARLRTEIEKHRLRKAFLDAKWKRYQPLARDRLVSEDELARIEHERRQQTVRYRESLLALRARREETEEELRRVELALAEARADLAEAIETLAQERREAALSLAEYEAKAAYLTVRAPFAGRIVQRHVELYEHAEIGDPLFTLSGLTPKILTARIPEGQMDGIAPGLRVNIKSDLYHYMTHRVYHGTVHRVAAHGELEEGGVVYEVEIALVDGNEELRVGSAARCEIILEAEPLYRLFLAKAWR